MLESHADRHAVSRIEVVSYSSTHYESEREVLSLTDRHFTARHLLWLLGVSQSQPPAQFQVGCDPPIGLDEVVPCATYQSDVPGFGTLGYDNVGPAQSEIGVAAPER